MDFPITGVILLLIGAYSFFFSPRLLYATMVFVIPFSATAIVNIGWGADQKGISAWIFFAVLWLLQSSLGSSRSGKKWGWKETKDSRYQLYRFLLAVLASLSVPFILSGTITVKYFRLNSNEGTPLHLSFEHFTQFAYLAIGVLVTIFVAAKNCELKTFVNSVKIYICSTLVLAAWGAFQFWCNISGVEYPSYLFNTNLTDTAQLFNEQVHELGLSRISSAAVEPSIFAQACLIAGILLMVAIGLRKPIFSRTWDWMAILLLLTVLILSTSTTAYFGLAMALLVTLFTLYRARSLNKLYLVLGAAAGIAVLTASLAVPFIQDFVSVQIAGKADTGSGLERLYSIYLAGHYFLDYPVLGLGWGSVITADLALKLLSNTGLVGFIVFVIFLIGLFKLLWRATESGNYWSLLFFAVFSLMVVLSEVTGFAYATGHLWFVLGLAVAAPYLSRGQLSMASIRALSSKLKGSQLRAMGGLLPPASPATEFPQ